MEKRRERERKRERKGNNATEGASQYVKERELESVWYRL